MPRMRAVCPCLGRSRVRTIRGRVAFGWQPGGKGGRERFASLMPGENCIERALELDPYNSFFHVTLAEVLLDEHRPDEAFLCLQRAATLQPDNMFVHVYLSEA